MGKRMKVPQVDVNDKPAELKERYALNAKAYIRPYHSKFYYDEVCSFRDFFRIYGTWVKNTGNYADFDVKGFVTTSSYIDGKTRTLYEVASTHKVTTTVDSDGLLMQEEQRITTLYFYLTQSENNVPILRYYLGDAKNENADATNTVTDAMAKANSSTRTILQKLAYELRDLEKSEIRVVDYVGSKVKRGTFSELYLVSHKEYPILLKDKKATKPHELQLNPNELVKIGFRGIPPANELQIKNHFFIEKLNQI